MKKLHNLFALVVMSVATIFGAGTVSAETGTTAGTVTFSSDDANKTTITRKVNNTAADVTNTFTYTIAADASNPATVTGYPASATVEFNGVTPTNNVATATGDIDMAGATFTKVGDYKFKVTETASNDATTYPLDNKEYYIYVSVRNEVDQNNVPTGNFVATLVDQAKVDDAGEKTDIVYESDVENTEITISKSVTGDLADPNEYFAFNLNIQGISGAEYTIDGEHSTDGTATVSSSTYTVGTTTTIYLKHGQTITISDLPEGTKYTITEQGATDYKTYIDGSTTDEKASAEKTITKANTNDNTAFVNNKEAQTLTGVFINIAPFVILLLLAAAGIYGIRRTAKNN